MTREARQPGWWHSFRDVLPNPYEVYIGLEAGAASIRNFEPVVMPGLLRPGDANTPSDAGDGSMAFVPDLDVYLEHAMCSCNASDDNPY